MIARSFLAVAIGVFAVGCNSLGAPAASPSASPTLMPTVSPPPTATAVADDPRADLCGAGTMGPVLGMFAVDHASDVKAHIPKMGKSAELDESSAPAFVVLFSGPVKLPIAGVPGGPTPPPLGYAGVVCVVVDTQPTFYTDVDTTGWHR